MLGGGCDAGVIGAFVQSLPRNTSDAGGETATQPTTTSALAMVHIIVGATTNNKSPVHSDCASHYRGLALLTVCYVYDYKLHRLRPPVSRPPHMYDIPIE